jgi:16S rRNA (guanine527-N7)-methyltransferase
MTIDEFIKELDNQNIEYTNDQLELLKKYADFLLEYNKKVNLTAIRDIEGVYLKHFYDSILTFCGVHYDYDEVNSLIDVGTGAGFPGVVIKIFYPHIKLTLLDSNNKKTKFLEKLVEHLGLEDVTVVNDRAENYVKKHRHEFDISIARAVSELRIIAELCLPLTRVGGHFIALKSNYEEELNNAIPTINALNSKVSQIRETQLPKENSRRTIIEFTVEDTINEMYPRSYEQIIKKALK